MTEGERRRISKETGPTKVVILAETLLNETIEQCDPRFQEGLKEILEKYKDVFPDKIPKGVPPSRIVDHTINLMPRSEPPNIPPYRLGPKELDELKE